MCFVKNFPWNRASTALKRPALIRRRILADNLMEQCLGLHFEPLIVCPFVGRPKLSQCVSQPIAKNFGMSTTSFASRLIAATFHEDAKVSRQTFADRLNRYTGKACPSHSSSKPNGFRPAPTNKRMDVTRCQTRDCLEWRKHRPWRACQKENKPDTK